MTLDQAIGLFNYWIVICLMMTGFYIVIARGNLIKTVIGLNIFQTSVFLLYITMGKVDGGTAPIIPPELAGAHDHHSGHGGHGSGHAAEHGATHAAHSAHSVEHSEHAGHQTDSGHQADSAHPTGGVDHADDATEHAETSIDQAAEHMGDSVAQAGELIYSNPLPSVLMLTAIVVGIATTALALALIVRIREDYGTIEEDEILEMDRQQ